MRLVKDIKTFWYCPEIRQLIVKMYILRYYWWVIAIVGLPFTLLYHIFTLPALGIKFLGENTFGKMLDYIENEKKRTVNQAHARVPAAEIRRRKGLPD